MSPFEWLRPTIKDISTQLSEAPHATHLLVFREDGYPRTVVIDKWVPVNPHFEQGLVGMVGTQTRVVLSPGTPYTIVALDTLVFLTGKEILEVKARGAQDAAKAEEEVLAQYGVVSAGPVPEPELANAAYAFPTREVGQYL